MAVGQIRERGREREGKEKNRESGQGILDKERQKGRETEKEREGEEAEKVGCWVDESEGKREGKLGRKYWADKRDRERE